MQEMTIHKTTRIDTKENSLTVPQTICRGGDQPKHCVSCDLTGEAMKFWCAAGTQLLASEQLCSRGCYDGIYPSALVCRGYFEEKGTSERVERHILPPYQFDV